MTEPGEPTPSQDRAPGPASPAPPPAATGWPGRPEAPRFAGPRPGSVLPAGQPAAEPPVRPPVPTGVPPRPSPLPPPRPAGAAPAAATTAATTVVPGTSRRPAPRRAPVSRQTGTRGRRARLAVKRLDPWSVFVTSLLLSLMLGLITIVAAVVLYALLSALGVPQSINANVGDITKTQNILTRGKFVGIGALIAAANVLLLTALATIGSMLYNLVASFTGGLELTLSERD